MQALLKHRGRIITESEVAFIRKLIAENPSASRRALSQKLCEAWNWRQPNGTLRDMVCRGLMLKLHRLGIIELPPIRRLNPNPLARRGPERQRPHPVLVDTTALCAPLAEIHPLELRQVRYTAEEWLFNGLIERYHYLGYSQPVGEQLKYVVYGVGRPVACLAWSSAARHLGARDRFLGWSAKARRQNIRGVLYNSRFLILPFVHVPYLASHLLSRIARVVAADWQAIYGHRVYFLETFVDPERFRATSYRAANWIFLGLTTGRGKQDMSHKPNRPIKQVFGYPLIKDFRQRLCEIR